MHEFLVRWCILLPDVFRQNLMTIAHNPIEVIHTLGGYVA